MGSCACSRSDVDRPRSAGSDASDGSVGREEATRGGSGGSEGTAASRSEQRARAAAAREAGEAAGGERREWPRPLSGLLSVGSVESGAALGYRAIGGRGRAPRLPPAVNPRI